MKKRLWIILTFGLTFTPAALADGPSRRDQVVERKTGVIEKVSQYNGASLACGRSIKDLPVVVQKQLQETAKPAPAKTADI